jgi:Xaa-Pro aminopeptidase
VKNRAEIEGARAAHRRDGAAMTRFLAWLAREAPGGGLDEIGAALRLEAFRLEVEGLRDLSFPTISAAGPNSALPHYRVARETNRPIRSGEIYLVDSGGQYPDGTTDITRTVAVGEPSPEMRDRFTRVLRGHIAIARAVFPKGTSGAQIDAFARRPLWEAGLDFDHGTGHGVGSYLSVHEGPQRLSKVGHTPLAAGMLLSNEPAYYRPGDYGIRIENLILVEPRAVPGAEREMMGFETLTLAPIDRALIEPGLLTPDEIAWLDAYHARVLETLRHALDPETLAWCEAATRPLG